MTILVVLMLMLGGCANKHDCEKEKFYHFYLGQQSGFIQGKQMTTRELSDEIFYLEKMLTRKSEGLEDWEPWEKVDVESYLIDGIYWSAIDRGTGRVLTEKEVEDKVRNLEGQK